MSRRFGRQQKRKMRAEIAKLEADKKHWQKRQKATEDDYIRLGAAMTEWKERMLHFFGPTSSLHPETKWWETDHGPLQKRLIEDKQRACPTRPLPQEDLIATVEMMYNFVEVLEELPNKALWLIRVIEYNNKTTQAAYSISQTEFEMFGLDADYTKHLAERIAEEITLLINKNRNSIRRTG